MDHYGRLALGHAFGQTVRELRLKKGIAQEGLALLSGVDRSYMSALERGLHAPTLELIYKLLPALGVTFSTFARAFERNLARIP